MRRLVWPMILILAATACSARNEVVFEGEVPTSAAAEPPSTTAASPPAETAPAAGGGDSETPLNTPVETVAPLTLSDRPLTAIPGRIVVNGPQTDSVYVLGPGPDPLMLYQDIGGFAAQPTWSPDGGRVAWAQNAGDAPAVMIRSLTEEGEERYPAPFIPFYIQWRPDGRALALLGAAPGGAGLAVLDLDRGETAFQSSATSVFLQWSPIHQDRMIAHLDAARLELLHPDDDRAVPLDATPGGFLSAVWTEDGRSVAYVRSAAGEGPPYQLALLDVESGEASALATGDGFFDFDFSPDGRRLAYSVRTPEGQTYMFLLDRVDGSAAPERIDAPGLVAWQWSPDSRKILLLGWEGGKVSQRVYQAGETTSFQSAVPTDVFLRDYLLFWGQYRLSLDLWSPDSTAFVFTAADRGQDRVFLQRLDDQFPVLLSPGSMAAFSPAAAGGGSGL